MVKEPCMGGRIIKADGEKEGRKEEAAGLL